MDAFFHADDGVDENREVGSATLASDGVGGACLDGVEVYGGGRCEVPAGREADDADFLRVNLPMFRICAHGADCLLSIEQRYVGPPGRKAVFKDDASDAVGIQPRRDAVAFAFGHQAAVAASGADDDGGAGGEYFR